MAVGKEKQITTKELETSTGKPTRIWVSANSQGEWSSNNNVAGAGMKAQRGESKDKWIKLGRAGGVTLGLERDLEEGEDPYEAIEKEVARLQVIAKSRTQLPGAQELISGKTEREPNND